ncbi:MAG TPA: DUF885 domain-containing protein [Bryobacteraceae bacterium]|jgi:hypothetical protein
MKTRASVAIAIILLSLAGCAKRPKSNAEWDGFARRYLEAYFAARPDVAVVQGRHEFDGKLPDFSPAALNREIARLHAARDRAARFSDETLDQRQRFDRDYLLSSIDSELFWRESARWPYRNPQFYSDAIDPEVYLTRPYAPLDKRMTAFLDYERALPRALEQLRDNLRMSEPLPRTYVDRGRELFGGMARYFEKDVPGIFSSVQNPELKTAFDATNGFAVRALKGIDRWFELQAPESTGVFALGVDKFEEMLRATERVNLPFERLEAIGREDMQKNLSALNEACAQFAPRNTAAECVAKANANKPKGSPVEAGRAQVKELTDFVSAQKLVTIPGTEQAQVDEAPPYQRWNFAYINIPGPFEKNMPSVYYLSPPDPKWARAEQDAYLPSRAVLLFTTAHEVMPGHFLQFLHSNRAASPIRRVLESYAFVEGWAHYSEETMWDAGLGDGDPSVHIGQLTEALLRDVRFLSAIGLHVRGMKVEEAERMFRESAFQDPGNARQQAARGTFDPAYLNYTLGKLMIRKLRDDWTASRGGKSAWLQFHDQFLSYGAPPIPLIRSAMLGASAGPPL